MKSSAPRLALVAFIASNVLWLSACEPCLGVANCGDGPPRPAVEGRVVTTESGVGSPGARIELVASYPGGRDSVFTTTDDDGLFSVSLPPAANVPSTLALRITPLDKPGYTIDSLPCAPVSRLGDACVLAPIVESPFFPIFLFLFRNDVSKAAGNVRVVFTRTGGSTLYGPSLVDPLQVVTDSNGVGLLFPDGIFATRLEPVIGDLTVELPPPRATTVRREYAVQPVYRFGARPLAVQAVGPGLSYLVIFVDSASRKGRSGVQIEWQRTAGIHAIPEAFTMVSNSDGVTGFSVRPLTDGTIQGNLTIRPPGGSAPVTFNGMSLKTFDADSAIVYQRWLVGASGVLYALPPEIL